MRLIDADALMRELNASGIRLNSEASAVIAHAPTVDAERVIRCVNCRFCDRPENKGTVFCRRWAGLAIRKDGYCFAAVGRIKGEDER